MQSLAKTIEAYYSALPDDRKRAMKELAKTINQNIPAGFKEGFLYGMPGWAVPLTTYPAGYHCDPSIPLGFVSIASQKNFIALYHMGLYADADLAAWFIEAYPLHSKWKLDMGKSCVRFKKIDEIPYRLIGELMRKMTVAQWIALYENNLQKKK